MRISAVLNIQDSGLVVTQIFLYSPLFDFGMECCNGSPWWYGHIASVTTAVYKILPVSTNAGNWKLPSLPDTLFSMPPFIKQRGVEVCFNLRHGNGYCRRENLSQIMISPAPGNWTPAARFLIIECIELFLQPPAGWSLSHWLHQYILYGRQWEASRLVLSRCSISFASGFICDCRWVACLLVTSHRFNHLCKRCKQRGMSKFPNCPVLRHDLRMDAKSNCQKQIFLYSPLFLL